MGGSIGGTPRAILGGAALIALGVYFGLRARPVIVVPSKAPASESQSGAPSERAPGGRASSPPSPSTLPTTAITLLTNAVPASLSDANPDALAALERQRAMFVDQCWAHATSSRTKPAPATYELDLAFDEAGHEVARGVSAGAGAREDVTQCVMAHRVPLEIPARGSRSHARVRITLP